MAEYSWRDFEKGPLAEAGRLQECRVWLLAGEEDWLRREMQRRLAAGLLSEEERAWGLEVFDLTPALVRGQPSEGNWAKNILRAVNTMPFFSQRKVVAVNEVHLLPSEEQQEIASALEGLADTSILILSSSESARKKRSRISAALSGGVKKRGNVVRFDALKPNEAIEWVVEEAQRAGKPIDKSAAALLVSQRLGTDLGGLKREIEKLALFAGSAPSITTAHVEEMTPRLLEERIFELSDAVSLGNRGQALAMTRLRRLLEAKEEPLRILWVLCQHFRLLWQAKGMLEMGWRPNRPLQEFGDGGEFLLSGRESLAAALAGKPWLASKLAEQARRFTWPQLEQAFLALSRCDLALKGLSSPPCYDKGLALELAIISICSDSEDVFARPRRHAGGL